MTDPPDRDDSVVLWSPDLPGGETAGEAFQDAELDADPYESEPDAVLDSPVVRIRTDQEFRAEQIALVTAAIRKAYEAATIESVSERDQLLRDASHAALGATTYRVRLAPSLAGDRRPRHVLALDTPEEISTQAAGGFMREAVERFQVLTAIARLEKLPIRTLRRQLDAVQQRFPTAAVNQTATPGASSGHRVRAADMPLGTPPRTGRHPRAT